MASEISSEVKETANRAVADWRKNGCPICGSNDVEDYFDVLSIPIDAGACFPSAEEARRAPTGCICLAICRECGYIGNRAFDYSHISYGTRYDISLHHSPSFQVFLESIARRLIETYDVRNKTIVEIGCGTGHFLRLICEMGNNKGIGIDPSVPRVGTEPCGSRDVTFIRDLYDEKYHHFEGDLICSMQMFNLLPDPLGFLKMIRRNLGTRHDTIVYLEVHNAEYQYDGPFKWNMFFEHSSMFHAASLRRAFVAAGFKVIECRPCYEGDQYLYVDAVPDPDCENREAAANEHVSSIFLEKIASFYSRYREAEAAWQSRIRDLEKAGKKVVGWGAGGRGVFFFNAMKVETFIPFVVDINPKRQHAYLPGTGQKIVPPEFLLSYKPDVIVVTHSTFVDEIRSQVREMGLQSEVISI
jgi:SAM-dependent methyltransferase